MTDTALTGRYLGGQLVNGRVAAFALVFTHAGERARGGVVPVLSYGLVERLLVMAIGPVEHVTRSAAAIAIAIERIRRNGFFLFSCQSSSTRLVQLCKFVVVKRKREVLVYVREQPRIKRPNAAEACVDRVLSGYVVKPVYIQHGLDQFRRGVFGIQERIASGPRQDK